MKKMKRNIRISLFFCFTLATCEGLAQERIPDSLGIEIDNRIKEIIEKKNQDNLDKVISTQNNIAGDLSNLIGSIQFLFVLVGALTTLILFAFTMYYRKEIRDKLKIAIIRLDEIEKLKEYFDLMKSNIEQEIKNIQKHRTHVESIAEDLNELRSRVKKAELKESLYNSFSSDLLNKGIFPSKDLKVLKKIVDIIEELEDGNNTISAKDYYYKGLYNIGRKDNFKAIEELKKSIDLSEPDIYYEAYDALSAAYTFSGQYEEAINPLLKLYEHRKDERTILNLVYSYMSAQDLNLAQHYCDLLNKKEGHFLVAQSEIYIRERKYDEAVQYINYADPSKYHRIRARVKFHAEDYDGSISELETKLEYTDREISSLGNSEIDLGEKELLLTSKASLYMLLTCNFFKKDTQKFKNEIIRNYYSAISIDARFSNMEGIEELEKKHQYYFSEIEKDAIGQIISMANSL